MLILQWHLEQCACGIMADFDALADSLHTLMQEYSLTQATQSTGTRANVHLWRVNKAVVCAGRASMAGLDHRGDALSQQSS